MENPTNKPEPSRAGSHDSSDGFSSLVALIESSVAIQKQMHMEPDATEVILSDAFFALSESERNALLDYAKSKGYAVPDAEMLAEPEPPKPEPVAPSTAHREESAPTRQHDEPRDRRQELLERLEALQEGGYQLTHADVGARMDRRHNRIFVGYGVKRTRDGHVVIGEAFAKRAGDGYETPLRDSSIAIPESVAERWENDAAFRSEVIRRAVDMRDELEGEERGGRYRGGTALIFDGIKDGQLTDELEAVQRDPSLLKPKWKYRLDNRNHYDEVAVEDISPKILEAVIADPHNYHQRPRGDNSPDKQAAWQRWNTWFGKELQRKREQVISRELERIYAPEGETSQGATTPDIIESLQTTAPVAAIEARASSEIIEKPTESTASEDASSAAEKPKEAGSERLVDWSQDEIKSMAQTSVDTISHMFDGVKDVPMFVKLARDIVTSQLLEKGRRAKPPRKIASSADIIAGLMHAFDKFYSEKAKKGEDVAGHKEVKNIMLDYLIAEVRVTASEDNVNLNEESRSWQLDELYEIAAEDVKKCAHEHEAHGVPVLVKATYLETLKDLLKESRRSKTPRIIPSPIDVLGALSHAFGDYYIQKGEDDAGRLESQEILLNELIAEIRNEAFGETTGQESEKELKSRQDITDYLVIKYLEIDDKRGGFDFKGSDTLKRRVALMREKLGE